jgi:hypothetical protein
VRGLDGYTCSCLPEEVSCLLSPASWSPLPSLASSPCLRTTFVLYPQQGTGHRHRGLGWGASLQHLEVGMVAAIPALDLQDWPETVSWWGKPGPTLVQRPGVSQAEIEFLEAIVCFRNRRHLGQLP